MPLACAVVSAVLLRLQVCMAENVCSGDAGPLAGQLSAGGPSAGWATETCTFKMQVDPFFVPVTEEEREEFGEEGQGVGAPNLARQLIDSVRPHSVRACSTALLSTSR